MIDKKQSWIDVQAAYAKELAEDQTWAPSNLLLDILGNPFVSNQIDEGGES